MQLEILKQEVIYMKKCSFFLLFLMLFLVSCSDSGSFDYAFIQEEGLYPDYNGMTIEIFQGEDTETTILVYSDDNTLQSEALNNRIKDIQNNYNVKIERTDEDNDNFPDSYIRAILADSCDIDIIYRSSGNNMWDIAKSGVLHSMLDFSDIIDLSDTDKYGAPGVLEASMFNGIPYAVQPAYWPGFQSIECFFVAYNIDMLSSMGIDDLHEYYENGTWTWDSFKTTLDSAYNNISSDDRLLTGHAGYLLNTILFSNNFNYATYQNGEIKIATNTPEAVEAIDFYRTMINTYGDKMEITDKRWSIGKFVEGKSLMAMAIAKDVTTGDIAYKAAFTYGIMPFPCGPSGTYGKWAQSVTRISGFAIPLTAKEPEVSATIISALFEPFKEFGGSKEGLISYYNRNVFQSDTDTEIYFAVDNNVRYDYDDAGLIDSYTLNIAKNINKGSSSELIQKYSSSVEKILNENLIPNMEYYLADILYPENS